jgi:hypothetical protein
MPYPCLKSINLLRGQCSTLAIKALRFFTNHESTFAVYNSTIYFPGCTQPSITQNDISDISVPLLCSHVLPMCTVPLPFPLLRTMPYRMVRMVVARFLSVLGKVDSVCWAHSQKIWSCDAELDVKGIFSAADLIFFNLYQSPDNPLLHFGITRPH